MQFNSIGFLLFFVVVFCIYQLARPAWRWGVLLAASLFFYAKLDSPHLILALLLVTGATYSLGRWIDRLPVGSRKRTGVLWLGILLNLVVLAAVRSLAALVETLPAFSHPWFTLPNLVITAGVSFYVFQAISYLVDIFLEEISAEHHLGYFALHISFFPKLLQGPIERASHLLPQLRTPVILTDDRIRSALLLIAWGLFKKVVVADRLGMLVGAVYENLPEYTGISLWLATFYYAFQIYCDFSGYTDIAIGIARLLGMDLSINFNKPYLAVSIADFWRRWHISFSSWIFDYIFKPVQMVLRRWKTWASPIALIITFFLSGIWHGTGWGFVVWGLLHGVAMAAYAILAPYERKFLRRRKLEKSWLIRFLRIGGTFLFVYFTWIFFRANTLSDAWYVLTHMFTGLEMLPRLFNPASLASIGQGQGLFQAFTFNIFMFEHIVAVLGMAAIFLVELPGHLAETRLGIAFNQSPVFRWFIFWLLVMCILGLGTSNQTEFVYFRF